MAGTFEEDERCPFQSTEEKRLEEPINIDGIELYSLPIAICNHPNKPQRTCILFNLNEEMNKCPMLKFYKKLKGE